MSPRSRYSRRRAFGLTALCALLLTALCLAAVRRFETSRRLAPALVDAVINDNVSQTRKLLIMGADPNARRSDDDANAPLSAFAVLWQSLSHHQTSRRGMTVLGAAAVAGHTDIAAALLAHGADPNATWQEINVPGFWSGHHGALIMAAELGRADVVRLLLRAGADPNATDDAGRSALLHASAVLTGINSTDAEADRSDYPTMEAFLVLWGRGQDEAAGIAEAKWIGRLRREYLDAVRALLASAADPRLRDINGMSALDYARTRRNNKPLVELLQTSTYGERDHH